VEASDVFCGLPPADLKALQAIARERTLAEGEEIFKEGDAGDGLYLIQDGCVEISGMLADKHRHVFSRVQAGDVFGEMAVLEDKPRSATAIARGPTKVYFFDRAELLPIVAKSSALALLLLREISSRLRDFNRQYLDEVLQTERLAVIGRFARSIVHDLKNPLNVIGLTAELVGSEKASAETRRLAQGRIRKQVDRISDMISEILDFTQGTDTQVILAPSDYIMFAEIIVKEIAPEAALKSVTVELESLVDSAKVLLDPKRLRRVFYNLINNATDAMPGGGKVYVRVRSENGQVLTEVEDTGPGIAPEVAEQLFEAFVTFGKAHGTGLGLSITKRILEDHRGWIKARNRNGSGSGAVFTFGLPVVA
jgi:signal transduction histidine kinase